jgi:hypothetical protein
MVAALGSVPVTERVSDPAALERVPDSAALEGAPDSDPVMVEQDPVRASARTWIPVVRRRPSHPLQ